MCGFFIARDFSSPASDSPKAPRKPAPQVAWDFWEQFRQADELFELRQYRPAIFRGLPKSPDAKAGLVEEKG